VEGTGTRTFSPTKAIQMYVKVENVHQNKLEFVNNSFRFGFYNSRNQPQVTTKLKHHVVAKNGTSTHTFRTLRVHHQQSEGHQKTQ
jgi:hypothetical protein